MNDLDRDQIAAAIGDCAIGCNLAVVDATTSTNDLAVQLAASGAPHGTLVVARRQTAGRGRRGRSWWHDPDRGIALSVLLRPTLPAHCAPELVHVAALAVDDAVHGCRVDSRIKWPNDIVIEIEGTWRKLAGMLVESSLRGSAIERAIIGIGCNVNTPANAFASAAGIRPTSLAAVSGARHDRAALIGAICHRLEHWLVRWRDDGFAALRPELVRRSATLGQPVRIAVGDRVVDGTAIDIAADGTLVVEDAAGQRVGMSQPLDT